MCPVSYWSGISTLYVTKCSRPYPEPFMTRMHTFTRTMYILWASGTPAVPIWSTAGRNSQKEFQLLSNTRNICTIWFIELYLNKTCIEITVMQNSLFKMNAMTAFIFPSFLGNCQANCDLGKYPMKAGW